RGSPTWSRSCCQSGRPGSPARTSWWTAARTTRAPAASPEEDHMSATMSRAEREEFLSGLHVGVLSVASPDGRGPLTAPFWYTYQPGGTVNVSTGRGTRKALAIEAAGRVSLCAQDAPPTYTCVTVEGPAATEER